MNHNSLDRTPFAALFVSDRNVFMSGSPLQLDEEAFMSCNSYSESELINELRDAEREVTGLVTLTDFDERNGPSVSVLRDRFGSWNEAKQAAGLTVVGVGGDTNITKRIYYDIKDSATCQVCGEGRSPALTFHHLSGFSKDVSVSKMVRDGYSLDTMLEEMRKCALLCENCHRCIHSRSESLDETGLDVFDPLEHTSLVL